MTDVVEQRGRENGDSLLFGQGSGLSVKSVQETSGHIHDTQRVGEPIVIGPREHELAHAQLLDTAKPLELGGFDQAETAVYRTASRETG